MADLIVTNERWLPIPEWEGLYSVSDRGRIRSEARMARCRWGDNHPIPTTILRAKTDRGGYLTVRLSMPGLRWGATVHKLVMLAFTGERPCGRQINHKNGTKTDNRLENLEYVTAGENIRHASRMGLRATGERHPLAKLSRRDIITIREMYAAGGASMAVIADTYDVAHSLIHAIVHRRIWRDVVG